jgi:hypothetical protein
MRGGGPTTPAALGFLTVVEHPQHGLFGGYLLLNLAGRPLEFHCTTPVKANRAQEILYGPTLAPYLYGELIGQALVRKASARPLLVCTDRPEVLSLRALIEQPVALVLPEESKADGRMALFDQPHNATPAPMIVRAGRSRLSVASSSASDPAELSRRLADLHEQFDLSEPFARIREAIDEAQRAGR